MIEFMDLIAQEVPYSKTAGSYEACIMLAFTRTIQWFNFTYILKAVILWRHPFKFSNAVMGEFFYCVY